jgi:hypothetical protein
MEPITLALSLAQFAPSILRFFGAGEKPASVAEKVLHLAQAATGAQAPELALAALRENAQMAQQFNLAVLEADSELEKAALADRQGARDRDIQVRKLDGGKNDRANAMIIGDVVGLVACLLVLTLVPDLPGEVRGIIGTIAGFFGLGLRDAHQFEFGSSRGSQEKTDLLAKAPAIK